MNVFGLSKTVFTFPRMVETSSLPDAASLVRRAISLSADGAMCRTMVGIRYLDDSLLTNTTIYELDTSMMNKLLCALVASVSIASPAIADDKPYYGELRERLESPVVATVESTKQPYDLEACATNAVLSLGGPVVLRDGPDNVIVGASLAPTAQAFLVSISLVKIATGTRMELRLRGKGWDERMKERMTVCATSPNRF